VVLAQHRGRVDCADNGQTPGKWAARTAGLRFHLRYRLRVL